VVVITQRVFSKDTFEFMSRNGNKVVNVEDVLRQEPLTYDQ
jgi:hypothetical protein